MFERLQPLLTGQGPLFWGAAAAAALGASLLMAALVMQSRRSGAARRPDRRRWRWPLRRPVRPGAARAVPGGYAPARPQLAGAVPPTPAGPTAPDLAPLLARLRRASDRLAALQAESGDSRLKGHPAPTEQLFRRGVG